MFSKRNTGIGITLMLFLSLLMVGCPRRDVGVKLLVNPQSLNFGARNTLLTLEVSKNVTSTPSGPIVVSAKAGWITPEACTDPAENCFSRGPLNGVQIPIRIDRSKTVLGVNRSVITVSASNASVETVPVVVEDVLQTEFIADTRAILAGQAVVFTDQSRTMTNSAPIIGRVWNFGDGGTSTATNPVHVYTSAGLYSVSLTVTTSQSSETVTKEAFVTVTGDPPIVAFEGAPTSIVAGQSVAFTDLSTLDGATLERRLWDFGDGFTSDEQNPAHIYASPGVYSVTLTLETQFGEGALTKPDYILVRANVAPSADFTLNPLTPLVGQPARFTDLSNGGSFDISAWSWDFDDGTTSTQQNPLHTFTDTGEYDITLTITAGGETASITRTISVDNDPPVADFTVSKRNPSTGEEIQFTDTSEPGSSNIISWRWDFGDDSTSTQPNPAHTYLAAGTFTVSLTVVVAADANNTSVERKQGFITVLDPPVAGFDVTPASPFTGAPVTFTNTSTPGTETALTFAWDFGDPTSGAANTSTTEDAAHTYANPDAYIVTLTVSTPTRSVTEQRTVVVDAAPVAAFSAAPTAAIIGESIQFTDATDTTGKRPVESRIWTFGDGQQSTAAAPSHIYNSAGVYDTSLTISYSHSLTGESFTSVASREDYITVTAPIPPTARFDLTTQCPLTGFEVGFTDSSTAGSRPITAWEWDFGDGDHSTDRNPTHTYEFPGPYTVTLTVTSGALPSGVNEDSQQLDITVNESTALDDYVRAEDPAYTYTLLDSFSVSMGAGLPGATAKVLKMTSQKWRTGADIQDGLTWTHNLVIIVPDNVVSTTGFLLIDGGSRFSSPPTAASLDFFLPAFAIASGSVVSVIDNVPSQPIEFTDEAGIRSRSEDEIIAYSYDKFLESFDSGAPDNTWPVLLAMAKSAVRAMDTVQDFLGTDTPVDDFVITGASKRGWTTWLTAAADCRVRAIAPMVIDVLNMDEQMRHHRSAYGFYSTSIYDYVQMQVLDRLFNPGGGTPANAQALLDIVDPFEYRDRLTMPKYIINSTGDQFFLPDSSQFYYDDIDQEKRLSYVPNTDHGLFSSTNLNDPRNVLGGFFGWYLALLQNVARPEVNWEFETANRMVVTASAAPVTVELWQAANPEGRDFRLEEVGAIWTSTTLARESDGSYIADVPTPAQGWAAYFVRLTFDNAAVMQAPIATSTPDFVFTTPVRVVPDVYPNFEGVREEVSGVSVLTLHGNAFNMGFQYGQLMAEEINSALPAYIAASILDNPTQVSLVSLDQAWLDLSPKMDPRVVDEISGIADGSLLDVQTVRRAHMVPVVERGIYTASAVSAWGDATNSGGVLNGYALNWPLDRGIQDFPVVVIYIPELGLPHASVTFAGFAFANVGMNLGGISLSETDDGDAVNNVSGNRQHFMPFFREALYNSASRSQVFDLADLVPPIRSHHFVLGDGLFEHGGAKILASPDAPAEFIFDNDDDEEFSPDILPGVVYAGQFAGARTFPFLEDNHGALNDQGLTSESSLQTLTHLLGGADNILNVVLDNGALELHVNYAIGTENAAQSDFVTIDMPSRIPPGPPVGR